ncbi:MAG: winged helix DNA-binding domain-containing protein [Planctomycetes bacterium]|nr:winged helix DNA-binding domain-containing protein [Planctomycetota bacterium]
MDRISLRDARRLAIARAGLAPAKWSGLPATARGAGPAARDAAHAVIDRFGYLQLDTISVAGARSHSLVLASRLDGIDAALGERLLVPGAPLFEYWGHEACWMPLALYPLFRFRRERFRNHPWWGDIIGPNRAVADALLKRARDEGPFKSSDLEGARGKGWWDLKTSKQVADALWSSGDLAIRERRGFQRVYDLAERVIPDDLRTADVPLHDAMRALIRLAFAGHGWADAKTVAATWRFRPSWPHFQAAIRSLVDDGEIVPCELDAGDATRAGWIRPADLDLAARLRRWRPSDELGVLLSPFDPLLWDRDRLRRLFAFDYVIEVYTPAAKRKHGYYCMPVLVGDRIVARVDLKADRGAGELRTVACHFETPGRGGRGSPADRAAVAAAVARHARAVGLPSHE